MPRTIENVVVELPLPVLGMLAIAHAQYDPEGVDTPQWGGYAILGSGLTVGLDLWTVTQTTAQTEGGRVECVALSKREGFHTAAPTREKVYFFPFSGLRVPVAAELTMATEAA